MDKALIKEKLNDCFKRAQYADVIPVFIAWTDIFGKTSIRTAYFDEYVEARIWYNDMFAKYRNHEHYFNFNGETHSKIN